ncbi:MAG: hypothetical protein AB7V00_05800 [Bacilli bacterium]
MILNFFINLKRFFSQLFQKLTIENFDVLFFGIILGFLLCFLFYLFIVVSSMRPRKDLPKLDEKDVDEQILKLITSAKNEYSEEFSTKPLKEKAPALKEISWNLINAIAKIYYPDSNFPIYELSIDELLVLNHYITNRIDSLFKGKVLNAIKKVRIAYILKIIEMKKKIDNSKPVKVANKTQISGFLKVATGIFNVFNPLYWVKKLMIGTTMTIATNKIALTIIDIVGEETNKVYNRSVFNSEKESNLQLEQTIYEIETMMDKEGEK